ncbi:MAG: phage holin family protein [Bernardetiaceae bacterium]
MKTIIKFLVSAVAIILAANIIPGVTVAGGFLTALWVALVLSVVNMFVKPLFILITVPITIFTLGIFLLFINALMIMLVGYLVNGFAVDGILSAFIFGVVYSVLMMIANKLIDKD